MKFSQRSFFGMFYLILFIGTLTFSIIIYTLYNKTQKNYSLKQENILTLATNSLSSSLLQYESILDLIGYDLFFNESHSFSHGTKRVLRDNSTRVLDNLLKLNPTIIDFSLANEQGQEYIVSKILPLSNLLEKKETKSIFSLTLKEKRMVIGRTYFHKTLKTLIIPISKAIRDKNNKVVGVITLGINISKAFTFLNRVNKNVRVFRSFDYYNQIIWKKFEYSLEDYTKPIEKEIVKKYLHKFIYIKNKTLKELQVSEATITFKENYYMKNDYLSSFKYINRYNLWLIIRTPLDEIMNKFYINVSLYLSIFILVYTILFYLFKFIGNYEKKKQEKLYSQAMRDPLTNLYNKSYINYEFSKDIKKKPYSILLIDIDNFKRINNNYGHHYGDIVLKDISLRLLKLKQENSFLIRYSADEFIYICDLKSYEEISILANNILNVLSKKFVLKKYQFDITSSIGISHYPKDGKNFDEVKRFANIAMDKAKKQRNSFCIFEESLKLDYLKTSLIQEELKKAIENNEIYMTYQPQMNNDGTIYGVEALVRWENKKLGFTPPDVFIKIAEETGLMVSLGKFIIRTSLKEIASLYEKLDTTFQLSINISYKQFLETDFHSDILHNVNEFNFNKKLITLEVTESIFIDDIYFILDLLYKIKKDGIKISLDDFGTGYSSLSLLKKLPINELKIDKSFVDDILFDKDALHMVEAIISIGKKLGMNILAEGVETLKQKKLLEKSNCDLFQGYLYSKPLKLNDLELFIKTMNK